MATGIDPLVYKIMAILSIVVVVSLMLFIWKYTAPKESNEVEEEEEESKKKKKKEKKKKAEDGDEAVVREPRGNNNNVGLRRMRNRVAVEKESSEEEPQEHPVGDEPEIEERGPKVERFVGKAANLSKKKLKKLQDKEDRAKYREYREQQKKESLEKEDKAIYERLKRRQVTEEVEQKEDEELELARQEREKKELEIYNSLKGQFTIEETGNMVDSVLLFEKNIEKFIEEIKLTKVVFVEELAAKYDVKAQIIVEKINQLDAEGRLSGIIDERGKYIYLTEEELTKVALFVKQRGRVNILDIQKESNRFINLNPQTRVIDDQSEPQESDNTKNGLSK
jgi:hypothetical protein